MIRTRDGFYTLNTLCSLDTEFWKSHAATSYVLYAPLTVISDSTTIVVLYATSGGTLSNGFRLEALTL